MTRVTPAGLCRIHRRAVEVVIDRLGRTLLHCPSCAWRVAGRCVGCGGERARRRSWYCRSCKAKSLATQRTRGNAARRLWRRDNPKKVAAQIRRYRPGTAGWKSREDYLAYQRRYWSEVRGPRRNRERREARAA